MSRFILKPLKWIWTDEVGTPYDPPVNGNTARILDPALPRVGEIFMDKQGVLYTHVIKDGNHEYVKCSGSGNGASLDGEILKARTPLSSNGQIKSDSTIVDVTSLDNVYVAALISESGTKKVLLGDFNDVLNNRSDVFIEACTVESDATRVFITRSAFGIVILVFGATSGLKLYALNTAAGATGERYIEKSIDLPSGVTFTSILQISEEGHFLAACGLTSPYVFLVDLSNPDNIFTETRVNGNVTFAKTISKVKQSFCPVVNENAKVIYYAKDANGSLLKIVYSNGIFVTQISQVASNIDFDDGFEVGTKFFVHKTANNVALFDGNTNESKALGFNVDLGTVIDDIDYQASNKRDGEIDNNASFTAIRSIDTANTDCVFASFFSDLSNAPGNEDKNAYIEHVASLTGLTKDIIYLGHGFVASVNGAKAYSFNIGFIEAFKHIEAAEVSSRFTSVVSTDKARKTVMNPSANDAGNGKFINNKSTFGNTEVGEEVRADSAKTYLHSNENGTSSIESLVDSSSTNPRAVHEIKRGENKVTSIVDTNNASIREGIGSTKYFEAKSEANRQRARMVYGNTEIRLREDATDTAIVEAVGNGWDTVFGSIATAEEAKSYLGSGANSDAGTQSYTQNGSRYDHRKDPVFVEQTAVVGSNKQKAGAVYNANGSGNSNNKSVVSIDASGGTGSNFYARNTVKTTVANGYTSIITSEATGTGNTAATKHSLINTSNVEVSTVKEEVKANESVVETRHIYTSGSSSRTPVVRMKSNDKSILELIPDETGTTADDFNKSFIQTEPGKSLLLQRSRKDASSSSLSARTEIDTFTDGGKATYALREGNNDMHSIDYTIGTYSNGVPYTNMRMRTIGTYSSAYISFETSLQEGNGSTIPDDVYARIILNGYSNRGEATGSAGYTEIQPSLIELRDDFNSFNYRTLFDEQGFITRNSSTSRTGTKVSCQIGDEPDTDHRVTNPIISLERYKDESNINTDYSYNVGRRNYSFYYNSMTKLVEPGFVSCVRKRRHNAETEIGLLTGFNDEGFLVFSSSRTLQNMSWKYNTDATLVEKDGVTLMHRNDADSELSRAKLTSAGIIRFTTDNLHPFRDVAVVGTNDFTKTNFEDPSVSNKEEASWEDVIAVTNRLKNYLPSTFNAGSNAKFIYMENGVPKEHIGAIGDKYRGIYIKINGEFAAQPTATDVVMNVNLSGTTSGSPVPQTNLVSWWDDDPQVYGKCYLFPAQIYFNGVLYGATYLPGFDGADADKIRYYPDGAKSPGLLVNGSFSSAGITSQYRDVIRALANNLDGAGAHITGSRLRIVCFGASSPKVLWLPSLFAGQTGAESQTPSFYMDFDVVSWTQPVSLTFSAGDLVEGRDYTEGGGYKNFWKYNNDDKFAPLAIRDGSSYKALFGHNIRMKAFFDYTGGKTVISANVSGDLRFYNATYDNIMRNYCANLPFADVAYPNGH